MKITSKHKKGTIIFFWWILTILVLVILFFFKEIAHTTLPDIPFISQCIKLNNNPATTQELQKLPISCRDESSILNQLSYSTCSQQNYDAAITYMNRYKPNSYSLATTNIYNSENTQYTPLAYLLETQWYCKITIDSKDRFKTKVEFWKD